MRTIVLAVSIALIACLGVLATLVVGTGRGFMYAPGIGINAKLHAPLRWAATASIAATAVAAILHAAAHARPRSYYQLLWWRDLAWLAAMLCALVVTLSFIGALLTYGAY